MARYRKNKLSLFHFAKICFVFFLLQMYQFSYSQNAGFYLGQYDDASWNTQLTIVSDKIDSLSNRMTQASLVNLETSYAEGSLNTAETFICFANRDRENQAELEVYYDKFRTFDNAFEAQLNSLGIPQVDFSIYSPFQILHLCEVVLDQAIEEINQQLSGAITIKAVPDLSTGGFPELQSNPDYYYKNGKAIFPTTLWGMPAESDLMSTIGYLGEIFFSPGSTGAPNGNINPNYLNFQNNNLNNQVAAKQTPTQIHITHQPLPSWMLTAHPEIDDFSRGFVQYDINNPLTYQYSGNMVKSIATSIENNPNTGPIIYVLSNEPHWEIGEGRSGSNKGISQMTINAYTDYLELEYSNIDSLNAIYGTNFTLFDELGTTYTVPIDTSLRGTPAWYDWMRFHMNSVTNWHQHLKDEIRSANPSALTSIKIRGRDFEIHYRDNGIDIEQLMDMQEVIGFDNHTTPRETHFRLTRPNQDWLDDYTIEWLEQSLLLDFSKSLYPDKPTFDSEWHGLSSSAWINYSIDQSYVKSGLWLAFTNGLSLMNGWWWYRHTQDKVVNGTQVTKGDFENKTSSVNNTSLSVLHQPVAYDAFGRAMKELNAASETIVTLVPEKREFLIYYLEEAAIQDENYMPRLTKIYEALKLLNYKVGFTTPSKIATNDHMPKAIIVPPTMHAKESSVEQLRDYKVANTNVSILAVESANSTNFPFFEKGTPATRDLSFVDHTIAFNTDELILVLNLETSLPENELNVPIEILDVNNQRAFGVFVNFGFTPQGNIAFSLINVSKDDRQVALPLTWSFVNMLTADTVANQIVLKPYEYLLLEANDPCVQNGGDSDFDGVCDPVDSCIGGDDSLDADNDGICDEEDICSGGDDTEDTDGDGTPDFCDSCDNALIGTSCDDADVCTTGDVYDSNCNCAGTFVDADNNGVCDALDSNCTSLSQDDFESNIGFWQLGGIDAARVFSTNSPSGSYSIRIRDNSFENSSVSTPVLDFSQADRVELSFDYQAVGMEANEDFFLELSTDGGINYTIFQEWNSGVEFMNGVVYHEDISILGVNLSAQTIIRFRCDASINSDEVFLDNINIEECEADCVDYIINSDNSAYTSTLRAVHEIESNNLIPVGVDIEFTAGNSILLTSGFEVEQAAVFHAFIESCNE